MNLYLFKIKIWQLLILLLVSFPLGYLFYQNNANKIIFQALIDGGEMAAENYCLTYIPSQYPAILSTFVISQLQETATLRYKDRQPSVMANVMLRRSSDNKYEFMISGKTADLSLMKDELLNTIRDISERSGKEFKEKFSKFVLHCHGKTYTALSYLPMQPDSFVVSYQQAYSKTKLYFDLATPFVVLYLFFIIFRYIKANYRSLVRRN